MDLIQYSTILTLGVFALVLLVVIISLCYFLVPTIKVQLLKIDYFSYIKVIGLIAIAATLSTLAYQFYYETPVCELCWWQRIFMYPIDIVALVSLLFLIRGNHIVIGALASIGAAFAGYHYYYHFQIFVLGKTLSLPCSGYGLLPACTSSPIVIFGFVTIPLMGLLTFLGIVVLTLFAHRVQK